MGGVKRSYGRKIFSSPAPARPRQPFTPGSINLQSPWHQRRFPVVLCSSICAIQNSQLTQKPCSAITFTNGPRVHITSAAAAVTHRFCTNKSFWSISPWRRFQFPKLSVGTIGVVQASEEACPAAVVHYWIGCFPEKYNSVWQMSIWERCT